MLPINKHRRLLLEPLFTLNGLVSLKTVVVQIELSVSNTARLPHEQGCVIMYKRKSEMRERHPEEDEEWSSAVHVQCIIGLISAGTHGSSGWALSAQQHGRQAAPVCTHHHSNYIRRVGAHCSLWSPSQNNTQRVIDMCDLSTWRKPRLWTYYREHMWTFMNILYDTMTKRHQRF